MTSVPIKLPWITVPEVTSTETPHPPLPEITLRASRVGPPIVTLGVVELIRTPPAKLPRGFVPVTSVPM